MFLHQTIAELAPRTDQPPPPPAPPHDQPHRPGAAHPDPAVVLRQVPTERAPRHFTMSMLLGRRTISTSGRWSAAIDAVVTHHDALRMRFFRTGGQLAPGARRPRRPGYCGTATCQRWTMPRGRPRWRPRPARHAQTSIPVPAVCIARVLFTRGADGPPLLFITVHHLVVDGVSWRILLGDLEKAYQDIRAGQRS